MCAVFGRVTTPLAKAEEEEITKSNSRKSKVSGATGINGNIYFGRWRHHLGSFCKKETRTRSEEKYFPIFCSSYKKV